MSGSAQGERSRMLEAAQRGERWAEQEVLELARSFARHLCRGGSEPDWEDVAQEACRRLFAGSLHHFVPGGPERSYLYSVVKAARIQMFRSHSRRLKRENESSLEPSPGTSPETRTFLHRVLSKLPESCRELLARTFFDGASTAELARELGLVESSVRSKQTRCLQKARSLLE